MNPFELLLFLSEVKKARDLIDIQLYVFMCVWININFPYEEDQIVLKHEILNMIQTRREEMDNEYGDRNQGT